MDEMSYWKPHIKAIVILLALLASFVLMAENDCDIVPGVYQPPAGTTCEAGYHGVTDKYGTSFCVQDGG